MARFHWAPALLSLTSLVSAQTAYSPIAYSTSSLPPQYQNSTAAITAPASLATALVNGTSEVYSVPFTVPAAADAGVNYLPTIKNATAVQAQAVCPGYKATNVQHTQHGFTATLELAGPACNVYGTDVDVLSLVVDVQTAQRLHVQIQPMYLDASNMSYYILPDELVHEPVQDVIQSDTQDIDLQFSYTNEPSFAFTVLRKSTGDILFDTRGSVLVYEDQFIEFVTQLPEEYNLYGMGEHIHDFRLGNNFTATFYNGDVGDTIDANLYGSFPIYYDTRYYEIDDTTGEQTLVTTQNTSATGNYQSYTHGVYLRNSHGLEALMLPTNLTWRAIGGAIDLFVFDGPTQADVTKQFLLGAAGLPAMQMYSTFGFHQCRWGYKNWSEVEAVVDNYRKFDIPLEYVWTDIDYMFQYRDFTNDPNTFGYAEGEAFLARLAAMGQHYVPIVDSNVYIPDPNNASDAYSVYTNGSDRGVFLTNPDGSEYIGDGWPGYSVFPDWRSGEAVTWWTENMLSHHSKIPWNGIWIDLSEASSFCIGSCGSGNLSLNPVHPPFSLPGEPGNLELGYPEGFNLTNATEAASVSSAVASQSAFNAAANPSVTTTQPYFTSEVTPGVRNINFPPYAINNFQGELATHAISPNATHADGTADYDIHNLWGHQILNATYEALLSVFPGRRPFIIGRSTFVGSGKWAGHWGGDNTSLFAYMYFSISQALQFQLFGIPMFGVDTCGFSGNTDEELCNRWMQLSAFFPFYRNHNVLAAISQEAYRWGSVIEASKTAMQIRYSLLPYIYTLFYYAHTTGSTVMRAVAWEFPNDPTLAAVDNVFMLGPSLLIVPALGQGQTEVQTVFPGVAQGEVWYDWYNQDPITAEPGVNTTFPAPLGHIPVFIRGGYVLPQQEALYTTTESRNSSWSLITALSAEGTATGQVYIDDGESIVPPATLLVDFTATNGSLYASARGLYTDMNALANVTILGVQSQPATCTLNGATISSGVNYNATSKVLSIKGLQSATSSGAWADDWVLSWA